MCSEAENGDEAVAKVLECRPDVVVMDMAMPVRDGISASREISAKAPMTPIVMHTLHYSTELEIEAKKAGVWAVVPKAEASDELLKTIETLLKRSEELAGANRESTSCDAAAGVDSLPRQNGAQQQVSESPVIRAEETAPSKTTAIKG